MAKKDPKLQLNKFIKQIEETVGRAVAPEEMRPLGEFSIGLIVKRTRLGYGVDTELGAKTRLKPLSQRWIDHRRQFDGLSEMTTPSRSNLTFTGQLLNSTRVLSVRQGYVLLGPIGSRTGSPLTNIQVALQQQKQGRIFMNLSELEYKQTLRFFRRSFDDLLKKRKLIK